MRRVLVLDVQLLGMWGRVPGGARLAGAATVSSLQHAAGILHTTPLFLTKALLPTYSSSGAPLHPALHKIPPAQAQR